MDIETVRRIALARHLNQLAVSSLRSNNDLHLFAAANLLQDAAEAFLLAVADHVRASVDQNTKFDKYFVLIDERIAPKELPFKTKLLRLNRIRVDSKHYGIQPARDECDRLAVSLREFFEEVSQSILGVVFSTVSAIDLLEDSESKNALLDAKAALETGDYSACSIASRKALYLEIEWRYDITKFKDSKPVGLLGGLSDAPFFARNAEYIKKNVHDPTDFIVLDHSKLDQDLMKDGVDPTAYWNIWRLTPEIYRTPDKQWVIKEDFDKLATEFLADKIEYIFTTSIDLVLGMHTARKAVKTGGYGCYVLDLSKDKVPVFESADKTSRVVATSPPGLERVDTDYRVLGLKGDAMYWHVCHFSHDCHLWGYIHADDVKSG
ncbi:MAG: hypothetical protein HY273_09345 [Gammaproteobacteria bacterium]|nr:hypothetical protein [Gammaproteobacteria bacterium]